MTLTAQGVLEVRLFGSPRLEFAGTELALPTKRALGVVAYLALEGATSRDTLANLLWDELYFENPKRNLRQELYRLSQTALAQFLEIGETIVLHCQCDARLARDTEDLIAADFLPRFEVPQAPNFHQWLQMQRETFSRLRFNRLETRAKTLKGLPALDMWLELLRADSLREDAVQAAMQLEAKHLGLAAARERYLGFKALLKAELGLEPMPETLALAEELGIEAGKELNVVKLPKTDVRTKRLLEVAGLLQQPFEAPMLFDVTGLTDFEVLESLETATSQSLFKRHQTTYELIAAPPALSTERRRMLERRIAKRLAALGTAPEKIAGHLEKAGERLGAIEQYLQAAQLASRGQRTEEAIGFYNRVLELDEVAERRFHVLQSRLILARRLDKRIWREAIRDLEREARSRTPEHRATADLQRSLWHLTNGEYEQALEFVAPHLERTGKLGAMAAYLQGTVLVKTGQLGIAETYLRRALEDKNALEDQQTAEVHNVLCVLAIQRGQMDIAKVHNQASLKGFARSGQDLGLTRALSTAGVLEMLSGQYRSSERMFKRSLELAVKIGDVASQIATFLNLSKSCFETSRFAISHDYLLQGLSLLEQHPEPNAKASYLVNLAAIERIQLQLDLSWERISTALEIAQTQNAMPQIASRALVLADMAIERHWFDKAKSYLELATKHLTPQLDSELRLRQAQLALWQKYPQQTLDILIDQTFINDDLEFRLALMAFAYLDLKQPQVAKALLDIHASSIYAPYVQAARIQTHAVLGTLEPSHFEPPPSQNALPFVRSALYQAFAEHHPENNKFTKEATRLEKMLREGSFKKPE